MALPDNLLTSSLWKAVLKIFLGFKSVSTWSIEICIFESHNGYCMSLTDAIILNGLWGRPALTIRTLVFILSEWGTERHSSLFLHDSKNCVFPEKCSWKGKDKISFISWGYETDKVGWFCFLVCCGRGFWFCFLYTFQCIPMLTMAESAQCSFLHWNVWKWMCLLSGKCELPFGSFKIEQIEESFTIGHSEQ